MDPARFSPVFLFLMCFQCATVAAHVEPPTNVTLHCHNMNNIVEWSYSQFPQGLKFKVDIHKLSGSPKELLVEPPALQADISFLSDSDNDYYLTVSALIGQNASEEAPPDGITFSYYKNSQANQKCFVDFPSVNVTAHKDGEVLFHFNHPWLLYSHNLPAGPTIKSRKKKSHNAQMRNPLPEFKYDVVIINQKPPQSSQRFSCEENVCDGKLVADPAQEKHCLSVTGEMKKMSVRATQEYCALPVENSPQGTNKSIYIPVVVVFLVAFGAVAFVLFIVYQKKTTPSTSLPKSMTFTSQVRRWTAGAVHETIVTPEVMPASPTPLLSPTEERESTEFPRALLSSTEPDLRLPIGVSTQDEGVRDVEEHDERAVCMQGSGLDGEEPQILSDVSSGYEKHPVLVALAPDEEAEGYRA